MAALRPTSNPFRLAWGRPSLRPTFQAGGRRLRYRSRRDCCIASISEAQARLKSALGGSASCTRGEVFQNGTDCAHRSYLVSLVTPALGMAGGPPATYDP